MKNYSEMSDHQINILVAKALDGHADDKFPVQRRLQVFDPCNSWADAGPIIDANKIAMIPENDGTWFALGNPQIKSNWRVESTGSFHNDTTPLRAAMIVFLMMQDAENANS